MSSEYAVHDVVALSGDLVSAEIDGEVVVMNIHSGCYVSIGGPGVLLFEMLSKGPCRFDALCAGALQKYDVDEARCASEVESFIQRMCDEGVAEVRTAA
jgi:hypothetical protein